jgi:mono/diheme cytochrome c family protein
MSLRRVTRPRCTALLTAQLLSWGMTGANAQNITPVEAGRREYQSACATCHGIDGRGDGPMKPFLLRAPADLTTLAGRHGGSFPKQQIADLIDGRGVEGPGPHGSREMPVWGLVYREEADWRLRGVPFPAEWSVRGRILSLVEYLATLQRF